MLSCFFRALQEFHNGINLRLKKPLLIIRYLVKRADTDFAALATVSKSQVASPRGSHEIYLIDKVAPSVNSHDLFTS